MDTVRVYDKQELEIANEINQRKEDKCMNNKLELVKSFKFNEVECNI